MPLEIRSLRANARLVHLGRDDFQEVDRVVDARCRVRFDFLRLPAVFACGAHRAQTTTSRDGTRTGGLDVLRRCLLRTGFGRSLDLGGRTGFLLREQTGVLRLTGKLCLALLLLVVLGLAALRSLSPLLSLFALLLP